jgi:predicted ribosome quality control (RQC) complex YloA/Tae2 family protein
MYKNYFFLDRFVVEINSLLQNSHLLSAFSQEKDKLNLEIKKDDEIKYLEISVNPGFPYINLRDSFHRAKKNTADFFTEYLPSEISSLEIATADRIVRMHLGSGILHFAIRGKYTNVSLLTKDNKLEHFKNPPEDFWSEEFLKEINSTDFIKERNIPQLQFSNKDDLWKEIKTKYPFIGTEIISEAKIRVKNENANEILSSLTQIIKEIFYEKPSVFIDEKLLQSHLGPNSFNFFPFTKKILFDDLISAFNFFISKKFSFDQLSNKKKKITKYLEKELSRLSVKLNKLKSVLDNGSKEEEYKKLGNLLLINLHSIKKGMDKIELPDIYNENIYVEIKLNETLPPKKNVDLYFEKAKNDRIKYGKSKKLFDETSGKFFNLKKIEQKLIEAKGLEDYNLIMKELNIKEEKDRSSQDDIQNKFKHYLVEGKYNVFVGKDSKNNDLLTTKFAKQNDYWFHARGVPGSHVVLRVENTKEAVPKNILKKTASLAAFHSKAKTAGTVPVSYTLKKYVVKKKGMEPGKVALLREDTLLVKPEIPDKCEYIEKE